MLGPGQFLARAQAGGYPKGVEGEALLETREELVLGEGAAERGVAGLRLERTFAQQLVDGLNRSAVADGALQEQPQALHGLQGDLAKETHVNSHLFQVSFQIKKCTDDRICKASSGK